jgi:RimJ/RimL family protein N-acetyltransferase
MKISIEGHVTILRTATSADAKDIIGLRNQSRINQYLSSSNSISLEEQINWMNDNAAKRDGFYFKIMDKKSNEFCGTVSIYQISNEMSGEFGRYICTKSIQAIEAELLLLRFAFDVMGLKSIYCRTAELNTKVWKQHYEFGFIDNGTELLEEKQFYLKKQLLTVEAYRKFNYFKIDSLISRFDL